MSTVILPKAFHPDFSFPRIKPKGNVLLDRNNSRKLQHSWIFKDKLGLDVTGRKNGVVVGSNITKDKGNALFSGDATSDRINLGSIPSTDFLSLQQPSTIIIRVFYDSTGVSNSFPRVFDKSNGGNASNGYGIWYDTGSQTWRFAISGDTGINVAMTAADRWVNLAVAVDGSTRYLYVDGEGNDSAAGGYPPTTTTNLAIGGWNHSTDREWSGLIEYIHVFNGALSEDKIKRIWGKPYQYFEPANPIMININSGVVPTTNPKNPFGLMLSGPFGGPI